MTWAVIRISDNLWLSGPHEEAPEPGEGERLIEVALGYPDTCEWSPSRGGFVDIIVPTSLLSRLAFQRLFTVTERTAIRQSTDPLVVDWRELAAVAEQIDLADADVIDGVNYLEAEELIGTGRAAEILSL